MPTNSASIRLTIILLIGFVFFSFPAKGQSEVHTNTMDTYIQSNMQRLRIPGLALVIVQGDRITYVRGYGVRDPSGDPVTPETPFILGSTSKSFTAIAVMQLVEAGLLDLDAPIQRYLPWFTIQDPPGSGATNAARMITLRHLLNHSSGIGRLVGENNLGKSENQVDSLERSVLALKGQHLKYLPGKNFEYANTNYQIAALVVQKMSGQVFEDYVQAHIFDPLKMRHSYTSPNTARKNGLATGYTYWFGRPLPANYVPYPRMHFASGFIMSSAEDLGAYLLAQLNGGRYGGQRLVSEASLETMHTPALNGYGMGWVSHDGILEHNGAVANYGSHFILNPGQGYGIAVLFNVNRAIDQADLYSLAPGIASLLEGRQPQPVPSGQEYQSKFMTLAGLLTADLLWIAFSVWMLRRWKHQACQMSRNRKFRGFSRMAWLVLPLLIEFALTAILLNQLNTGLVTAVLFLPDLTLLLLLLVIGLFGWGIVRTVWSLKLFNLFGSQSFPGWKPLHP